MSHNTLRLCNVYDISTNRIIDGVEVELPPGVPLPTTIEAAHAALDALAAAAGVPPPTPPRAARAPVGSATRGRNPAVEAAVAKARALAVTPAFRAHHGPRRVVDFRP